MDKTQKTLSPILYMAADVPSYMKLRSFLSECVRDYDTDPNAKQLVDAFELVSKACSALNVSFNSGV